MKKSRNVLEFGEPCVGNTGEWGRVVVYEVNGPLGKVPVADWERLLSECDCMSPFLKVNSDGVRYCGYCLGRL